MKHWQLKQRQSLPLEAKIRMSEIRIRAWHEHWQANTYVSFSGGKDSTVLLHLVRKLYPKTPAVFVDTGLEYPEIKTFVKTKRNVEWVRPKMPFYKVIEKYGYPVVSKENAGKIAEIRNTTPKNRHRRLYGDAKGHGKLSEKWKYLINSNFKISDRCCYVMKKAPIKKYEKETERYPFTGTMASDSAMRTTTYVLYGCNSFKTRRPISSPMGFWLEQDVWNYIKKYRLRYSSIYDKGYLRTGCMFCMFGVHMEKEPNRFQRMQKTHPKLWDYCIHKLGCGKVMDYINVNYQN